MAPDMTTTKVPFEPTQLPPASPPPFHDAETRGWSLMWRSTCTFSPSHFSKVMTNLIKNPNLNSSWLYRADILYDDGPAPFIDDAVQISRPAVQNICDYDLQRTLVRRLIPRNEKRDAPMNQTCTFYESSTSATNDGLTKTLVIYTHELTTPEDIPFYHPKVKGVAQLLEWDATTGTGTISVSFLPFERTQSIDQVKLERIAYHLLEIIHKHGHSAAAGYTKRVHHDVVIPQVPFQTRYSDLKNKYAKSLLETWAEVTDPTKHVFEDLGIAAFLIELWSEMYRDAEFPGFVDIGCGNGLLVHILRREGYMGWGFDARERKSWAQYDSPSSVSPSGRSLQRYLLLPSIVPKGAGAEAVTDHIHDGSFPKGTFIISNHADELTPWTPVLATLSDCPFLMIPCCSHDLKGDKFRAPVPRDKTKSHSSFSSLVDWVTMIAEECGWEVETEMMRIPSTRNVGLLGRRLVPDAGQVDVSAVLTQFGGAEGYSQNVASLLKSAPRGH